MGTITPYMNNCFKVKIRRLTFDSQINRATVLSCIINDLARIFTSMRLIDIVKLHASLVIL